MRYKTLFKSPIGPLHDPVTWYGINYAGTQITQWDFWNKEKSGWTGKSSYVLKVPQRYLRSSIIYTVPCDRFVQRAYSSMNARWLERATRTCDLGVSFSVLGWFRHLNARWHELPGCVLFRQCMFVHKVDMCLCKLRVTDVRFCLLV